MKNIFKNLLYLSIVSLFVVSCDDNVEVTGYDPANYVYETVSANEYSIAIDQSSVTETSFDVVGTSQKNGMLYYMVADASAPAPSNEEVHANNTKLSVNAGTEVRFTVTESALLDAKSVKVYSVFKSVDNFITKSVSSVSQTLTGCPPMGGMYNAVPNAFDTDFTPFTVELVATANKNEFTLLTTWGPNLVADLTGNPGFVGQFVYPSTLTINDDLSVTVVGSDFYTSGGSGTYTVCDDVIQVTLTQELFTNPFTVDVTFTR